MQSGVLSEITIDSEGRHNEFIVPQDIKDGTAASVGVILTIVDTVVLERGSHIKKAITCSQKSCAFHVKCYQR